MLLYYYWIITPFIDKLMHRIAALWAELEGEIDSCSCYKREASHREASYYTLSSSMALSKIDNNNTQSFH